MGEAWIGPPKSGVEVDDEEESWVLEGSGWDSFLGSCFGCSGFSCSLGLGSSSAGLVAGFEPPASSTVKSLKASTEDSSSTITAMG